MPTTTAKSLRTAALRGMRGDHDAELAKATAALSTAGAPDGIRRALACIAGRERPLSLPTGADLAHREDLARYLAICIERRLADEPASQFIAFEATCERWVCPAEHPVMPLDRQKVMAIRRLKRALKNFVWSPALRLRKETGRPVELVPVLRIFALVGDQNPGVVESSVAMICRDLDPRAMEGRTGPKVQPIESGTVAEQVARMLALTSASSKSSDRTSDSDKANLSALTRILVAGVMPVKAIAGGNGALKVDLKLAIGRAKAAAVARHGEGPSPIAPTETYAAISDMLPAINGKSMRLPFYIP